jgi:hypothetical protein
MQLSIQRIFSTIIFIFIVVCGVQQHLLADTADVDMVIYSYDRPLQLYALLESINTYMTGIGCCSVIYRASDNEYAQAYEQVKTTFSAVQFLKQGAHPRQDFKPLTMRAAFDSPHDYIIFAVDDNIVTDYVNLNECVHLLDQTEAYGFYLRLGKNLNYCYTINCPQRVPQLTSVVDDVYCWRLGTGHCDWGYPNTVDMTVYRKDEIRNVFTHLDYYSPNVLEGSWASTAGTIMQRKGLCFGHTKIVNLPLNRVQNDYCNRSMNVSPQELLDIFNRGMKIDIIPLFKFDNPSAHMEYTLTFVPR